MPVQLESYHRIEVTQARLDFLNAAAEHPEIRLADKLRSEVYEKILARPLSLNWEDQFTPAGIRRRQDLDAAMSRWAESFHLELPWVIREAWGAINRWHKCVEAIPFNWREIYLPPDFHFPPRFRVEPWPKYEKRAQEAFEIALREYRAECEREPACTPPAVRETCRAPVKARYAWAALRHCRQWTYQQIADDHGRQNAAAAVAPLEPANIRYQVRHVLSLIGISQAN